MLYPKYFFRFIQPVHVHLKTDDKVDFKESHCEKSFFLHFFAFPSSSRHEKHCQMSLRLFSLFRGCIYQQWALQMETMPIDVPPFSICLYVHGAHATLLHALMNSNGLSYISKGCLP